MKSILTIIAAVSTLALGACQCPMKKKASGSCCTVGKEMKCSDGDDCKVHDAKHPHAPAKKK
jgi:hypothetical protein